MTILANPDRQNYADSELGFGANFCPSNDGDSVADRDPGLVFSGSWISDPRSQTHIFDSLMTNFWVKSTKILSVLAKRIFLPVQK